MLNDCVHLGFDARLANDTVASELCASFSVSFALNGRLHTTMLEFRNLVHAFALLHVGGCFTLTFSRRQPNGTVVDDRIERNFLGNIIEISSI